MSLLLYEIILLNPISYIFPCVLEIITPSHMNKIPTDFVLNCLTYTLFTIKLMLSCNHIAFDITQEKIVMAGEHHKTCSKYLYNKATKTYLSLVLRKILE